MKMKKISSTVLLGVLVLVAVAFYVYADKIAQPNNLLKNPSFEEGDLAPYEWWTYHAGEGFTFNYVSDSYEGD